MHGQTTDAGLNVCLCADFDQTKNKPLIKKYRVRDQLEPKLWAWRAHTHTHSVYSRQMYKYQ